MKTNPGHEFTIWGNLRIQVCTSPTGFSSSHTLQKAQVLCFGDVSHQERWYPNLLLLKLELEGEPYESWNISDDYPALLPYMKPVAGFREYVVAQLEAFLETLPEGQQRSRTSVLWMGIQAYIRELKEFDELRTVLGQARSEIERLQRKLNPETSSSERENISRTGFRLLETLGLHPRVLVPFLIKGPMP